MSFEQALATWLPSQRWFAGKGTPVTGVSVVSDITLAPGDPGLRHLIFEVAHGTATDTYQVFAGFRPELPDRLEHARIGPAGDGLPGEELVAYDALHDPDLTRVLLESVAAGRSVGTLRFAHEPGCDIETGLESLVLTGEQSNTSLVFGEAAILKVFRRLSPGPNGDLEVPRALARRGSSHVAAPLGWIEGDLAGTPTVFAVLSTYLRAAVDGWSLAGTSVRDLYALEDGTDEQAGNRASQAGGDFAGEAHRLGEATAQLHEDLAAAFGTSELPPQALREMTAQMEGKLLATLTAVPELAPHAGLIREAYAALAALDAPVRIQRIHGDYHLGQVMRTQTGWVVLDFEGEPAAPPAQRRARSLALRDVAGMIRSLDYAARYQIPGGEDDPQLLAASRDWAHRNQAAFCAGYAHGGPAGTAESIAAGNGALLWALICDKAVYEVMYEARHRPSWLFIPLGFLADAEETAAWLHGVRA